MSEEFAYRVSHPDFKTVEVTAIDKLWAVSRAARIWGVPWTEVARGCTFERLAKAAEEPPAKEVPAGKRSAGKKQAAGKK